MDILMTTGVLGLVLLVLLAGGLWIGLALTTVGFVAIHFFTPAPAGSMMATTLWDNSWGWALTALPLFVWMGEILFRAKLSEDMFTGLAPWLDRLPGRLLHVNIVGCGVMAAVAGSSAVTSATVGRMSLPELKQRGYDEKMSIGTLAGSGTLGLLIPPSIMMIVYGISAQQSISRLFIAGIVPGLLLALMFSVYCMIQARSRSGIDAPDWAGWPAAVAAFRRSVWALLAPPVVMGGIYFGIFTASEAAAAGSLYAILVAVLVYRNFGLRDLWHCAYATMRTSMMVFLIIAGAAMFGHAITLVRLPVGVTEAVVSLGLGPIGFVLVVMGLIFVLGMFLESIAIILITTPILLPTMISLGIDPIWYGVLLMINLELAMITPPVGMNLFVIKGITGAQLGTIVRGAAPFVAIMVAGLGVLIAVPELATWLPAAAGFGR